MRFLLGLIFALAFFGTLRAQTISTLNGKSVGCAVTGNVVTLNGTTIGTSTGNISKLNNLNAPTCGGPTAVQSPVLVIPAGQMVIVPSGSQLIVP